MNSGRYLSVGILLILAGGCASQNKPAGSSLNSSSQIKTSATQPMESPKWEASSTPAELLAQKTAAFAKTVQPDAPDPDSAQQPEVSAALLGGSGKHRHKDTSETAIPPVDASPIAPPASPLMPSPELAKKNSVSDGPKIMPESADFAVADAPSKDALGTPASQANSR